MLELSGKRIVLTADRSLMTNYRGNFLYGFIACGPYEVLPEWVFDKVFCPAVETDPVTGEAVPMEFTDTTSDPATIQTRATAALQANSDVDAILSVGPHVCEAVDKAVADLGMTVHHACFDLSPAVMDLINAGRVSFTIDQQQRLQGYMPIIVLHLYNNSAGLLPGANIPSGPGFVDKSNASSVAALAGIDR